jgi:hypothetical protein
LREINFVLSAFSANGHIPIPSQGFEVDFAIKRLFKSETRLILTL